MVKTSSRVLLSLFLAIALVACGGEEDNQHDNHDNQHDNQHAHEDASRVEIATRGTVPTILAVWTDSDGWTDEDGTSIDVLPTPVDNDGTLEDFTAEGARASLTVRFFDSDGDEISMSTVSRDDDPPRERTCSEYSVRYHINDNAGDVFFWPPVQHPDSNRDQPISEFVELADGSLAAIFHCDHIHIYPQSAGAVDMRFLLWHGDHSDSSTDPISVVVN